MTRIPINDDENKQTSQPEELGAEDIADNSAADEAVPGGDSNELTALRSERDQLYQRLARAQADFQNSRRRLESDKEQAVQFANSTLIKSLLPVIDNFERALAVDPSKSDAASIQKGLQLVHDQLLSVLKSSSVEEIAPPAGTPFDPNQHQALMQQPSDQYTEPTVTQLLQKGYALHGRTLRPAQVAVSKTA
jgi:molecular chaperone GrpE